MSDETHEETHEEAAAEPAGDFIRAMVAQDLASGKYQGRVATRFPPEPNGYLHIGHAKSICLNFGVAREFGGTCNLRFDDTNPETESPEYVASIQRDIRWLGFDWDGLFFASDYFERFYTYAQELIRRGLAYVDSLSDEEIRAYRGTVAEPGRESPYRSRSVAENLDLLRRMREGEFLDGAHVVRAKGDMAAANMKMRDPLLYRIRHAHHYRTGDAWCIYPMYDYAHCLSDSIEGITHSLCTLEFENNRDVYDWVLDHLPVPRPRPEQTEFARLQLGYTLLSKRKLLALVTEGHVAGWDDPRMPTLSALRRRGHTPEAIRNFAETIGVAKANSVVDPALLEHSVRDDLNTRAPRVLAVLRPLKVVIENYPEGEVEELEAPLWPRDVPREGSRKVPFSRVLYVEREDFREDPPAGFHRLAPGREVRLRYAYLIRCERVVKDPSTGEVLELVCTYDPATRGGHAADGRKVQGTIHWVSAAHAVHAEVRLYDRLFTAEQPDAGEVDFRTNLNPRSLEVLADARLEPSLATAQPGSRWQFERQGYFYLEPESSTPECGVWNRIVTLKDSWARLEHAAAPAPAAASKAPRAKAARAPGVAASPRREKSPELEARAEALLGLGLSSQEADTLTQDAAVADFFDAAHAAHGNAAGVARWIVNEVLRERKDKALAELPFDGAAVGELVALVDSGTISGRMAKEIFTSMLAGEGRAAVIVERQGLRQLDQAEDLLPLVERVLAESGSQLAAYRGGRTALFGFFVGQVMKLSGGKANPQLAERLLRERLDQA